MIQFGPGYSSGPVMVKLARNHGMRRQAASSSRSVAITLASGDSIDFRSVNAVFELTLTFNTGLFSFSPYLRFLPRFLPTQCRLCIVVTGFFYWPTPIRGD